MNVEAKKDIKSILGLQFSSNLKKYLRLPNVVGRRKKVSFQSFKDIMKLCIDSWRPKMLSQGGKEIFMKSTHCRVSYFQKHFVRS